MFGSDGRLLSQSDLTVAARNYRWHGVALGAACGLVLSHHLEAVPSFELMLFPGSDAPGQVIARGGVGLFWRF